MSGRSRERQALGVAPRYYKPPMFGGTDIQWRALCELYPAAETPEIIMAVIEYCVVRRLDPYKRPVHVVPMWSSRLGRRVQVVMQGIAEIETIAARTGEWAGMDEPKFGPEETRIFRGVAEDDEDGGHKTREITLTFPSSCIVPVYRLVKNVPRRFVSPVYFMEAYGRASFKSELPNARWQTAPRQMLHKCSKAAALRSAFPEQGFGYAQEEMEDRDVDGDLILDGVAEPPPTDEPPPPPPPLPPTPPPNADRTASIRLLEVSDRDAFLAGLDTLLKAAMTAVEIDAVEDHRNVQDARVNAPPSIRQHIDNSIAQARKRVG